MAIAVHIALQNVYAELVSFQLLGILLPTNIETQIVEQKVKERNIQTATIRQQIQVETIYLIIYINLEY